MPGPDSVPKHVARPLRQTRPYFLTAEFTGDCPDFRGTGKIVMRMCLTAAKMGLSPSRPRSFRYLECMRLRWLFAVAMLLAGLGAGVLWYVYRQPLARQWALYCVGAADSPQQAQAELARCETAPDREVLIAELAKKWATGNRRFDHHLAVHLGDATCGEPLRAAFSAELGRRRDALARSAHFWSWRAQLPPDQQIASVLAYLDALLAADPPRAITWREVLDLQAIFQLTDRPELAAGLSPDNWQEHYRRWQAIHPIPLPHTARPEDPLP